MEWSTLVSTSLTHKYQTRESDKRTSLAHKGVETITVKRFIVNAWDLVKEQSWNCVIVKNIGRKKNSKSQFFCDTIVDIVFANKTQIKMGLRVRFCSPTMHKNLLVQANVVCNFKGSYTALLSNVVIEEIRLCFILI